MRPSRLFDRRCCNRRAFPRCLFARLEPYMRLCWRRGHRGGGGFERESGSQPSWIGDGQFCIVCLRHPPTALFTAPATTSAAQRSQNSTVPLFGFCFGSAIRIRVGNKLASPTTSASPVSSTGNKSPKLPKLSGNNRLTTVWSSGPHNVHTISERVDCIDQRLPRSNQHDFSNFVPLCFRIRN